jgi:hypothetical protein
MPSFAPTAVLAPHHFEVRENDRGYWVAKDREGLIGGVFRTQRDALRFALFEVAGDSACVKVITSPNTAEKGDPIPPRPGRKLRISQASFMASK